MDYGLHVDSDVLFSSVQEGIHDCRSHSIAKTMMAFILRTHAELPACVRSRARSVKNHLVQRFMAYRRLLSPSYRACTQQQVLADFVSLYVVAVTVCVAASVGFRSFSWMLDVTDIFPGNRRC